MTLTSTIFEGLRDNPRRLLVFLRTLVVVAAASLLLYQQASSALSLRRSQRADALRQFRADPVHSEELLWSVPLLVGALAEFFSYRVARVVNTAYYGLGALYLAVGFTFSCFQVFGFSESEHWIMVLLLLGIPYAALAVALYFLYRATSPARLAESDAA